MYTCCVSIYLLVCSKYIIYIFFYLNKFNIMIMPYRRDLLRQPHNLRTYIRNKNKLTSQTHYVG